MAFQLTAYARPTAKLIDCGTPMDFATEKGSIQFIRKNVLNPNVRVTLLIQNGEVDSKGNKVGETLPCSAPLSKEIRTKLKAGVPYQEVINQIAGLRIIEDEQGRHFLSLPAENALFGSQASDINAVAYENNAEFKPEDFIHL